MRERESDTPTNRSFKWFCVQKKLLSSHRCQLNRYLSLCLVWLLKRMLMNIRTQNEHNKFEFNEKYHLAVFTVFFLLLLLLGMVVVVVVDDGGGWWIVFNFLLSIKDGTPGTVHLTLPFVILYSLFASSPSCFVRERRIYCWKMFPRIYSEPNHYHQRCVTMKLNTMEWKLYHRWNLTLYCCLWNAV